MNKIQNEELRRGLEILASMIAEQFIKAQPISKANHTPGKEEPFADQEPGLAKHPPRRLYTVKQWVERHPCFQEGGIRQLVFNSERNGFHSVIRRLGRKVLIDEDAFFEWLDRQNSNEVAQKCNF